MGLHTPGTGFVPVAHTTRSGVDDCVHFGAAVAVDADGEVVWSVGDATLAIYPRSANKPFQLAAMLDLGWNGSLEQRALAAASHGGSPRHVRFVRSILAAAGLDEGVLANTPDLPLDAAAAEALLAAGGARAPIYMNCSGKHAAMLATCVHNGWDPVTYLGVDHPLQRAVSAEIARRAGAVHHIGVDGCGAPAHVISLMSLARGFASIAGERGAVWEAMTTHPDLVGDDRRDATRLMRAVPGMLAKEGADGVMAAAVPGGVAVAVKVADGAQRARGPVTAAVLRAVGIDVAADASYEPVLGHGRPVGEVRALL